MQKKWGRRFDSPSRPSPGAAWPIFSSARFRLPGARHECPAACVRSPRLSPAAVAQPVHPRASECRALLARPHTARDTIRVRDTNSQVQSIPASCPCRVLPAPRPEGLGPEVSAIQRNDDAPVALVQTPHRSRIIALGWVLVPVAPGHSDSFASRRARCWRFGRGHGRLN
jgi:hypothetical protein